MQDEKPGMHLYKPKEELLNTISHAFAAFLSLIGLIFILLKLQGKDSVTIFAMMIFSLGLIGVYSASTLYHGTKNLLRKRIWQKVDHAMVAIILLAAAAPLLLIIASGTVASVMLSLVFASTAVNVALNLISVQKYKKHSLGLLGLTVIFVITGLIVNGRPYPKEFYSLLCAGFAVIFAGGGFYLKKSVDYTHFIWHISNIIATGFLYFAFYFFVIIKCEKIY